MIGNRTPQGLKVLGRTTSLMGFPELLDSGPLTIKERRAYLTMALQRLEVARRDLKFAATIVVGVGSKKPEAE